MSKDKLMCGLCGQTFPIDVKVGVILEHLGEKHHIENLADFFILAFCIGITKVKT